MWEEARKWLEKAIGTTRAPRVVIGENFPGECGVVIEIALGNGVVGRPADARLTAGPSPVCVHEIVRYCGRRNLPVAAWLVSGAWRLPAPTEQVARWLQKLASAATPAPLWIHTGRGHLRHRVQSPMPVHFEKRLVGHLRRYGCEVVLSSASMAL